MNLKEIKQSIIDANPGLEDFLEANTEKRNLALELRVIRKKAGFTEADIAKRAGMTMHDIERIESPSGSLPTDLEIRKYRTACIL